ncbi:glycoside hydrolase family 19 protein [Epilithonimonas xixisoli]|uniref:Putative chitinase n=1 Tax=Epilithonimonas xixisoli TaxID=1476462 RepID=A0A4R8IEB8_9FLAO|nr:glycoside hydrolase family 19 protein [Epilithonimonas xixisoli]TDX84000.1 putative chitinase [Epilithonimonas xixisoli]
MESLQKHPLTSKYKSTFIKVGLVSSLGLAHFFGQASHESNLLPKVENLNYKADALIEGFGRHRISIADARKYGRTATQKANQEAIANIIYGGAWGKTNLGNTQFGDGWKYRGRGIFQITGRANYEALTKWAKSKGFNVDYVANPDALLNEADSIIGALWYWSVRGIQKYAEQDNLLAVSKIINLGSVGAKGAPKGLADRVAQTNKFRKIFK